MRKRQIAVTGLVFVLYSLPIYAAEDVIQLQARVRPVRATLGDEIKLILQIEHPKNISVTPPALNVHLAPFEVKRIEPEPPRYTQDRTQETFGIILTVFQLGDLKVPPVSLRYTDSRGTGGVAVSDPLSIKIVEVPKRVSDKDDIRPIKGPVSMDTRAVRNLILGFLAAGLAIFLIVKIILRRSKKIIDPESLKPPHDRAMLELERLQQSGLLAAGNVKAYYSELADILRRYLERRFQVETFDKTTAEIARELKQKEFAAPVLEKIKQVLENSDLVKFAKLIPKRSLADESVAQLVQVVEATKPMEEENVILRPQSGRRISL